MAAARRALTASDRSRERARKFGRAHTKPQAPEKVAFTLLDAMAPKVTLVGSAHETDVYVPGGKEPIAKLPPGERAVFVAKTVPAGDSDNPKKTVLSWSREVEAPPAKADPKPAPAPAAAPQSAAKAP